MKKIYFLILFFGALLFCACEKESIDPLIGDQAQPQLEDGALKGAHIHGMKHAVPFKGKFIATLAADGPGEHPMYLEGPGIASHLGKTFLQHGQTWDFVTGKGFGNLLFTAANGDELWAEYTNSQIFAPPISTMTGNAIITGGTGRFVDAMGSFEIEATFNVVIGEGTAIYVGEIMY